MLNLLLAVHLICSILLIIFILLNQGKGSELSILNQNNDILSSKDSNLFLNKLIIFIVIISILINFLITIFIKDFSSSSKKPIVNLSRYINVL